MNIDFAITTDEIVVHGKKKKCIVHALLFQTRAGYGNLASCMVRLWLNDNIDHV
jgi:hypothetical protein